MAAPWTGDMWDTEQDRKKEPRGVCARDGCPAWPQAESPR